MAPVLSMTNNKMRRHVRNCNVSRWAQRCKATVSRARLALSSCAAVKNGKEEAFSGSKASEPFSEPTAAALAVPWGDDNLFSSSSLKEPSSSGTADAEGGNASPFACSNRYFGRLVMLFILRVCTNHLTPHKWSAVRTIQMSSRGG
jgi:hypothetical protein